MGASALILPNPSSHVLISLPPRYCFVLQGGFSKVGSTFSRKS